jgi:polyisoprenoid-binding protein YceI
MTEPPSDTSSVSSVAAGTYRLDPDRSTIQIEVKTFAGLLTVRGSFRLQSGQVTIAADSVSSTAQAVIAAGSFASGNTVRDRDVIAADLLDASRYPTITFTSTRVEAADKDWVVYGSITAHGTGADAEMRVVEARMEGAAARFRAIATLDRTSFGLTKRRGLVGQAIEVDIVAVGVPS